MPNLASALPVVNLQPGEAHLARTPALLKTLLGSCVGVTFWSPRLLLGALCHGVLPRVPEGVTQKEGYRYVDFAILDLIRQMEALGVRRSELQIKVFGGADVLHISPAMADKATVGRQNCESALAVLAAEKLPVFISDLGGPVGRTIQFHTGTGEVLLRRLLRMTAAAGGAR